MVKTKNKKNKIKKEKKRGITIINILIAFAILSFIGNLVYQLLHWREAFEQFKALGFFGSIAVIGVVFIIRKWLDSL